MAPVQSQAIRWIEYEPASGTLSVGFRSGAQYDYLDVPEAIYEAFLAADSIGGYFATEIRDRYAFRKIG